MTVVDDVKSRLDILEVVSAYVPLNRSGRSHKAPCPFHQEKTPSFFVFPDRQTWRCFGACATGGDVFSFVMKAENLEFAEVLNRLAQQAGVTLPTRQRRGEQQVAFEVNEKTRQYFQDMLGSPQGASARAYLSRRGITQQTIDSFELGLSPSNGESLGNFLSQQGFTREQSALAGAVRAGENGRYRDLFRGRLMIPIRNGQGELGGFGGRALDDATPKYLNSPRTPVFDKGRILYALHLAKEPVRQKGVVVVEGYMDAIMAHQHGFNNVVASMGTALTADQVAEIRRLTGQVVMALDPDAAGQQATIRSLATSWEVFQKLVAGRDNRARGKEPIIFQRQENLTLRVAEMPEGLDPDEVIRRSTEEWARLIEGAVPLFEYLLPALSSQVDLSTPQGKARLVETMFPFVAAVPEPIQQDYYFQALAAHVGVGEETLRASVARFATQGGRRRQTGPRSSPGPTSTEPATTSSAFARLDRDPVEEYCLALVLQHPELLDSQVDILPEYFRRMENREIYHRLLLLAPAHRNETVTGLLRQTVGQELMEHLETLLNEELQELTEHLGTLLNKELPPLEHHRRAAALESTVHRLEERYLRELKVEEGMRFSGESTGEAVGESTGSLDQPLQEVLDLNQRIRNNENTRNWMARNPS